MKRKFDVCGIGNALVDILAKVSEKELEALGFEKATMRLVEEDEQRKLLEFLERDPQKMASGGSVANSIIALGQLGGRGAFTGCLGTDLYGSFYREEFSSLGIDLRGGTVEGGVTGTSAVLVTPDAERTMRTCLASSASFQKDHIDETQIASSEWLFVEGYLFANPTYGQSAVKRAIDLAKGHGTKIALTCSEAFVVEVFGEPFSKALEVADFVFANASEATALTKTKSAEDAFKAVQSMGKGVVVTASEKGAYVSYKGDAFHVDAYPCTPVDLTGAGDMFAGTMLYGITSGADLKKTAQAACCLAKNVITQVGARLHSGTRATWEEIVTP